jgi:KDO2-lipid IV(A) lauroyltransferase
MEIQGLENIDFLKNSKVGAIFFSAHIANWELSPRIARTNDVDLSLIYRAANNKLVDAIMCSERSKHNISIIPKGAKASRQIIEALRQGRSLAMLVDQKMNDGINVPFFGRDAMTASAIARLALNFNCPLIPVQVIRTHGANFIVKIIPPLSFTRTGDNSQDIYNIIKDINLLIELWIRENPTQWFWLHKRWIEN